jgi:hypothetical protein
MAINYPKFDQKINDHISASKFQESKTRPGLIMIYDKETNTATVLLDERRSGAIGDIVNRVPCPFTYGVQAVAPSAGMRCLVGFRNDSERDPYVISYMIDPLDTSKIIINNNIDTGIPKFMA